MEMDDPDFFNAPTGEGPSLRRVESLSGSLSRMDLPLFGFAASTRSLYTGCDEAPHGAREVGGDGIDPFWGSQAASSCGQVRPPLVLSRRQLLTRGPRSCPDVAPP